MSQRNNENLEDPSTKETIEDVLPGYSSVADFTKDGYKNVMEAIKHANSLPTGRDWNFYTTFESFKKLMSDEAHTIMDGINSVLRKNEVGGNMRNNTLEKKTEILIDANDIILERVANSIDEINGIRTVNNEPVVLQTVSAQLPINGSWNKVNNATFSVSSSIASTGSSQKSKQKIIRLLTAENIVRPQKFFKDKIDNRNDCPWEPRIKEKPNSLKPLAIFLEETVNGKEYSHPYEFELDRYNPPDNQLNKFKVIKPKLLQDTPLIEINKPEQLLGLVEELRQFKEIAIDLEHHSYRSFMGITCLMQISTIEKDYLIDTLELRDKLYVLNEVFTKPTILKIFHGAHSDIQWLQRDLSLYIVNMFDTYFAAKQLEYSGLSLAYLMQRFCNFIPNKQFQLADWRIRPLPDELKSYAREDTHYLIYIYQNMRNELIDKAHGSDNLIKAVYQNSTELCKMRYFKLVLREDTHLEFYRRCNRMFDNRQLFALKELHKWRDGISRELDESTGYVLPNNMLLEIVQRLPREMQGILACCSPVPPLVRANLLELHKIILKALEKPFEEPILKEDTRARGATKKMSKINVDSPLHCPHDLTKSGDFRDDLPTLLHHKNKFLNNTAIEIDIEKAQSMYSVFYMPENSEDEVENEASKKLRIFRDNFKFLGPFERYKLVKPFIQAREKKLAEEKAKEEAENAKNKDGKTKTESEVDNRTDEERIESIREHFLQLARKILPPKPELPKNLSLVQMGGSKKRKHDESILRGHVHSDYNLPENTLHTPIPNLQITVHTNTNIGGYNDDSVGQGQSQKRKSCESKMDDNPNKAQKLSRKEKKRMRNRNNHKGNAQPFEEEISGHEPAAFHIDIQGDPSTNNSSRGFHRIQRGRGKNWREGHTRNDGGESSGHQDDKINHNRGGQRGKRGGQQQQRNEEFNAYDYSMVDFKQFQGGAKGVERSKEFKSKIKARGNKSRGGNRGHNKSMTFGRGRGR